MSIELAFWVRYTFKDWREANPIGGGTIESAVRNISPQISCGY